MLAKTDNFLGAMRFLLTDGIYAIHLFNMKQQDNDGRDMVSYIVGPTSNELEIYKMLFAGALSVPAGTPIDADDVFAAILDAVMVMPENQYTNHFVQDQIPSSRLTARP